MRRFFVVLSILLLSNLLFAQDETLFSGKVAHGGFAGPVLKGTIVNDEYGALIGARGAYLINHSFSIGLGGYGLVNNIKANPPADTTNIRMGYGGLILGYSPNPGKLVHLSFNTLIGGGGVALGTDFDHDEDIDEDEWRHHVKGQAFFVIEPELNMILNVTRFLRIGMGGSYRYVKGLSMDGVKDADLSGPAISFSLKFGFF